MNIQESTGTRDPYEAVPGCCTTERIRLRPLERRDAEPITQLISNWNVMKMLSTPPWPYSRQDADDFIDLVMAQPVADPTWIRAIADRRTDEVMGVMGIERSDGAGRLGYWLGEPFWGKGLMSEAVQALLTMKFETDRNVRIESGLLQENFAARPTKVGLPHRW